MHKQISPDMWAYISEFMISPWAILLLNSDITHSVHEIHNSTAWMEKLLSKMNSMNVDNQITYRAQYEGIKLFKISKYLPDIQSYNLLPHHTIKLAINMPGNIVSLIGKFNNVTNIKLRGFSIQYMTTGLSKLTNLKSISLIRCNICKLPDLSKLTNLKSLILTDNILEELPELPNSLRVLDVKDCMLRTIPT